MADKIGLNVGDAAKNVNAGKDNEQNVNERTGNVVNNYLDSNNQDPRKRHQSITLEERLDRLEVARNEAERTLVRLVSLMDGNPGYRLVGIPDQLAAYIKANEDWKDATEKRILEIEIEKKEKKLVMAPSTAIMYAVIAVLALLVLWLAGHYFQTAGVRGAAAPVLPFILNIAPYIIRGYSWMY